MSASLTATGIPDLFRCERLCCCEARTALGRGFVHGRRPRVRCVVTTGRKLAAAVYNLFLTYCSTKACIITVTNTKTTALTAATADAVHQGSNLRYVCSFLDSAIPL
jgi:hypothetical protein